MTVFGAFADWSYEGDELLGIFLHSPSHEEINAVWRENPEHRFDLAPEDVFVKEIPVRL